jgi:lipoprotein NlpI
MALRNWDRLRVEQVRRKSATAAAEATFEVGRLSYLMGKRDEAFHAFDEAIDFDEDRDQSYIDATAFLVERGEADAALDIYRRALSKPNRQVSEYVKVYASLWVMDLSVRNSGTPDATAEAYLKGVDSRRIHLRPARAAAWYLKLARYALGKISYDQLLAAAMTTGQKAEVRFYEAMHRLQRGQNAEANQLWKEVLDSKMVSFFEYEMASRYLRVGAPSRPTALDEGSTI